jgi:single-stranded DNA-binding protein
MSLHALASGTLTADPQSRQGTKERFATATLRVLDGTEALFVSIIGFGKHAEELLEYAAGDAVAISGKAKLTAWTARDGTERHGISLTIGQIAALKPKPIVQRRSPARRPPKRQAVFSGVGPPLPNDTVGDLWVDEP